MLRAASLSTSTIAAEMKRPTIGSAAWNPSATPTAPTNTPSEVRPSVRACKPSATSAADPIRRPVRIRYCAATSFPRNPATAAIATQPNFSTSCGCRRRCTAS
jgi:hypothetical protein